MGITKCSISLPITKYKAHTHGTWEIVCQLEGEVETVVGDMTCLMQAGDVLLIPPHTPHKGAANAPFRDLSLCDNALELPALAHLHDEQGQIATLLSVIHRLHSEDGDLYRPSTDRLVQALAQLIEAKLNLTKGSPAVERVKQKIYLNIDNSDFSLSDAVAESGFDKDYFRRCFKAEVGKTPTRYLIDLRIAKAKQLLEDPKHFSVEAIARSCGFADSLYFSTCFKKHVGLSPLSYRKNKGNG